MVFRNKAQFCVLLILLFTCLIPKEIFSQEFITQDSISDEEFPDNWFDDSTMFMEEDSSLYLTSDTIIDIVVSYPDTFIFKSDRLPIVFNGNQWDSISFMPEPLIKENKTMFPETLITNRMFEDVDKKNKFYTSTYRSILHNDLDMIKYNLYEFPEDKELIGEISPNIFQSLFAIDYDAEQEKLDRPEKFHPKRKYWFINGNHLIQFSQNYISDNWYKGGTKNLNLLNVQSITVNYRKGKVQFNNLLEWKLSLFTNSNDTLRDVKFGEDLIRIYSDFGIHAINNWYYSTNIEIKTQLFQNFKENTNDMISAPFSPLIVKMGILGMKYQVEKKSKKVKDRVFNVSADISPLSIQYTYVGNDRVDETRFGVKAGSKAVTDLGSTINSKFVMKFNKNVTFSSRFSFFTNYDKVIMESENELNMPINRYFSTRLYVFARFDDSEGIVKDNKLGYFQLNELLSFGFNFKW